MFKNMFLAFLAFLGFSSQLMALPLTVDETAILADVASVGGSGVTIALAVAGVVIGLMLIKKIIK